MPNQKAKEKTNRETTVPGGSNGRSMEDVARLSVTPVGVKNESQEHQGSASSNVRRRSLRKRVTSDVGTESQNGPRPGERSGESQLPSKEEKQKSGKSRRSKGDTSSNYLLIPPASQPEAQKHQWSTGSNNVALGSRSLGGGTAAAGEIGMMATQAGVAGGINQQQARFHLPQGFPQSIPQHSAFTPVLANLMSGNPLVWAGMKDIQDDDIDEVLNRNWNTPMVLVAWSPNRRLAMTENDAFIRSCTEFPWRELGDVVFFCAGGKTVRCHSVLLQGVLPAFTNNLLEMYRFQFNQYIKGLPFIPLFVTGVEQRIVNHLINLLTRGTDILTGGDISVLKMVMEVINIVEMSVCIAPNQMGFVPPANFGGGFNVPQVVPSTSGVGSQPAPRVTTHLDTMLNATVQDRQPVQAPNNSRPSTNSTSLQTEEGTFAGSKRIRHRPIMNELQRPNFESEDEDESRHFATTYKQQPESELMDSCQVVEADVNEKSGDIIPKGEVPVPVAMPRPEETVTIKVENECSSTSGTTIPNQNSTGDDETFRSVQNRSQPIGKRKRLTSEASGSDGGEEDYEEVVEDKKKRTRTVYGKEIRVTAIAALSSGRTVREVAEGMNLPPKLISRWKYEAKRADDSNMSNSELPASSRNIICDQVEDQDENVKLNKINDHDHEYTRIAKRSGAASTVTLSAPQCSSTSTFPENAPPPPPQEYANPAQTLLASPFEGMVLTGPHFHKLKIESGREPSVFENEQQEGVEIELKQLQEYQNHVSAHGEKYRQLQEQIKQENVLNEQNNSNSQSSIHTDVDIAESSLTSLRQLNHQQLTEFLSANPGINFNLHYQYPFPAGK